MKKIKDCGYISLFTAKIMSSLFIDLANCDHLKDRQGKSSQSKFESDVIKAKKTTKTAKIETNEELHQKKLKEWLLILYYS